MKMRIRGNSLRFRLTRTEAQSLAERGECEDAIQLGLQESDALRYRIECPPNCELPAVVSPSGTFGSNAVTAQLPPRLTQEWAANGEQVGIYFETSWGLKVAIEKDFKCLDSNREEDESDNYEHPAGSGATHPACSV